MIFLLRTQMTHHKQCTNDRMIIVRSMASINAAYETSTGHHCTFSIYQDEVTLWALHMGVVKVHLGVGWTVVS